MVLIKTKFYSYCFDGKVIEVKNGEFKTDNTELIKYCEKSEGYEVIKIQSYKEVSKKYEDHTIDDMRALCVEKGIDYLKSWNKMKIIKVIEGI